MNLKSEQLELNALVALMLAIKDTGYRFTTITPLSHHYVNARAGNAWARKYIAGNSDKGKADETAQHTSNLLKTLTDILGWSRPFYADDVPAYLFGLLQDGETLVPHADGWRCRMRISSLGDQLYMHSAYPTTDADAVFFGPDTYRYVREIEYELARRSMPVLQAADIGSGAGPGAISIALKHPQATVYALDINAAALRLTAVNATAAGASNVQPVYSNLLDGVTGHFDLITANPPYLVDAEQRAYRHGGGDLGAGLSLAIIDAALPRLNKHGTLLLYTGVAVVDGVDVFKVAAEQRLNTYAAALPSDSKLSWHYEEIDPDVFGEELLNACYAETDRISAVILRVSIS